MKDLCSIKMRASLDNNAGSIHLSGAEDIVSIEDAGSFAKAYVERGLSGASGRTNHLSLKLDRLENKKIRHLDALPVTTVETSTPQEGFREVYKFLEEIGVSRPDEVIALFEQTYSMRGAMLLDARTLERLEPDHDRGIRVTCMGRKREIGEAANSEKQHFCEALVLATKTAHCPGICGEICVSDDKDYVTGYVASKTTGYRRITCMKRKGSSQGGRIFLWDGDRSLLEMAIEYLQTQPVLVHVKNNPCANPSRKTLQELLCSAIEARKAGGLYRSHKCMGSAQGAHIRVNGRDMVLMASNSYLDLTHHPYVIKSATEALQKYGYGSGGSRLVSGNTEIHERLEAEIASFKGTEAALIFNTGYMANVAAIQAIMKLIENENRGIRPTVFSDELNHASIIDGCRLSNARVIVYRHNDMDDLRRKIERAGNPPGLLVSDAVFSMDGDILDLPTFLDISKSHGLFTLVDEAHATGTVGATGHGLSEYFNCGLPDILIGTLSKAVGGEGGFAAGSFELIDYLRNAARGYIFSTALSPVVIAANRAALKIIDSPEGRARIAALHKNVELFRAMLQKRGIQATSETPVFPIPVGDEKKAVELSAYLHERGYFVTAIRYPAVPRNKARLRVTVMATHTISDLKGFADALYSFLHERNTCFMQNRN